MYHLVIMDIDYNNINNNNNPKNTNNTNNTNNIIITTTS